MAAHQAPFLPNPLPACPVHLGWSHSSSPCPFPAKSPPCLSTTRLGAYIVGRVSTRQDCLFHTAAAGYSLFPTALQNYCNPRPRRPPARPPTQTYGFQRLYRRGLELQRKAVPEQSSAERHLFAQRFAIAFRWPRMLGDRFGGMFK